MPKFVHQSFLLVFFAAGIIIGTILVFIFRQPLFNSWLWLIVVVLLLIYAYCYPSRLFLFIMLAAGIALAFFRSAGALTDLAYLQTLQGQTIQIGGTIKNDPDTDEDKTSFKLGDLIISEKSVQGIIYVSLSKTSELARSDHIELNGKLTAGFGTYAGAFYRPTIIKNSHQSPKDFLLKLRDDFAAKIKQYLPATEASLGLSYLLGLKSGLDDDINDVLRVVGLTHIVVASGTHLSIIIETVRKLFGKISRFTGLICSLLLIILFMSMIGWTPSILRAGLVSILSLAMWYVGRHFSPWRIILLVMAITMLIDPTFLIDLGWLLSFASYIGIMILAPRLRHFFYGKTSPPFIAEIILTTISATIMVTPILLYFFGTFSLISVLANLLILPTLALTMALVFLTGLFAFLPIVASIFGFLAKLLLDYHLLVVNFFGAQKMFLVEISNQNPWIFLLYIPLLLPFVVAEIVRFRKKSRLYSPGVLH